MSLAWMIYFEQGPDDLQPLADALARHKLTVQASSPKALQVSDGHATVQVAYNDAAFVAEEARDMLAQAPHPDAQQIARCSRRIELTWSEEDACEATNLLGFIEPAVRKVSAWTRWARPLPPPCGTAIMSGIRGASAVLASVAAGEL